MLGRDRQQHAFQWSQPPRTILRRDKAASAIRPVRPTPMPQVTPRNHKRSRWHRDLHSVRVRPRVTCRVFARREILIF